MTELPNFIDVYTYAVDPNHYDGTPIDYVSEYINGQRIRTNHDANPSFDHMDGEWWAPPRYTHISEDWSLTGNTSLYVEPSEGFGRRRWHNDPFGF